MRIVYLSLILAFMVGCSKDKSPTESIENSLAKNLIGMWNADGIDVEFKSDRTGSYTDTVFGVEFKVTWEFEGDILIQRYSDGGVRIGRIQKLGDNVIYYYVTEDGVETGEVETWNRIG